MAFKRQCGPCHGSGYLGAYATQTCGICSGIGEVEIPGNPGDYRNCGPCHGSGYYGGSSQSTCVICCGLGIIGKSVVTRVTPVNHTAPTDGFTVDGPRTFLELPDRRVLYSDAAKLVNQALPVGILFIDLDNFKQVNDVLGHAEGDKCLEKVSEILGSVIAGRGKVYRYGGDEFTLIMVNTSAVEAAATGERVRLEVEKNNVAPE